MEYHHFDPGDLPADDDHPCDRRSIADAADLGVLHAAVYTLDPGEELSRSYHYHTNREELFHVLEGELVVETPAKTVTVAAGEVLVVAPDSPIRPHNPADGDNQVRVFGVGAPRSDPGIPYTPEDGGDAR